MQTTSFHDSTRLAALLLSMGAGLAITSSAAPLMVPYDNPNHEISFADFNGDRRADLAVRQFSTGNVAIYLNQGATFSASPSWTAAGRSVPDATNWDALFADMNGDGKADLINRSRSDGNLFVHLNLGSDFQGTASTIISGVSPASQGWRSTLADVNGDAYADLVNVDLSNGSVYVHYNTAIGYGTGAHVYQLNLAVPATPYSGWEPLIADCNGDKRADFINLSHPTTHFYYHEFNGSSFSVGSNRNVRGPREHYEHEYFLADIDADAKADIVQHNLRTGDILAFKLNISAAGDWHYSHRASMKYTTFGQGRPNSQRRIQEDDRHVLNAIMWYDNDHFPETGRPDNGWWLMNPNHPGIAPTTSIYRSGTSILGTYNIKTAAVIKQHAYWMRSIGINVVLIDWTNIVAAIDPDNGGNKYYHDQVRLATQDLVNAYSAITEFTPPKICIVIRMPANDPARSALLADEVYQFYVQKPNLWYVFNDGTASKNKPMMVTFVEFEKSGWISGPQWVDSRFNMRYANGYLMSKGITTSENNDWHRVSADFPYWNFVENTPHPTKGYGYYTNLYRRLTFDTSYMEQAATWVAVHRGGLSWDGQLDVVNGKRTIERYSESMYSGRQPRNLLVNRFNYPVARLDHPQEGISWNYSTMIEPSLQSGFDITYKAAKVVHDLAKLQQRSPGKPVVTLYTGTTFAFSSSNYPTEYRVSATADGAGYNWQYLDINQSSITLPPALQNRSFYLRTKNAFGESELTLHP